MNNTIFDEYQANGILPSIGGDDAIYQKLKDAYQALAAMLKESPDKIPLYALVAIDNQVDEKELILKETEEIVQSNWNMVRSKFTLMPIALYRAIILSALDTLSEDFAPIIYWSLIDVLAFQNESKEHQILIKFIQKVGDITEQAAIDDWSVEKSTSKSKITKLSLKLESQSATVSENTLKERLINASGPHAQGETQRRNGANSVWSNSGSNWAFQFAPLAAKGIAEVINQALKKQNSSISENTSAIESQLNKFFTSLNKNLKNTIDESIKSSVAVERRSQLLWWKETLYSRKLKQSYRALSQFECAIAIAFDLFEMLPPLFPISVEFMLKETFLEIFEKEEISSISLKEFLTEVYSDKNELFLKSYFEESDSPNGRMDLVSFMNKLIYYKTDIDEELLPSLGIKPDTQISFDDISVWILHCLAANRVANK